MVIEDIVPAWNKIAKFLMFNFCSLLYGSLWEEATRVRSIIIIIIIMYYRIEQYEQHSRLTAKSDSV